MFGLFIRTGTFIAGLPWRNKEVDVELGKWGGREVGRDCLIDEMQILADNGWKHL